MKIHKGNKERPYSIQITQTFIECPTRALLKVLAPTRGVEHMAPRKRGRDLIRRLWGKITEIKLNSRTEDIASSYLRGTDNQKTHLNNKS